MFRSLRFKVPFNFLRKKIIRPKVTFNGPFVEYPKCNVSAALNGEVHFEMPQSGSICIKPSSLACIEGDLESLTTKSSYVNGVLYRKVVLQTSSQIIPDQGSSVSTNAFQVDAPKKWQVNGLKNIFSWCSVSFGAPNDMGFVVVEGPGFISLNGDYTILKLEKNEGISLLRLKFVATDGDVLSSDFLVQESSSILSFTASQAYSWYENTLKPVFSKLPFTNQLRTKRMTSYQRSVSEINPKATTVNLSDVKVTGPGLLIINNA